MSHTLVIRGHQRQPQQPGIENHRGTPEAGTSDTFKNLNYRCPVCGEMVDASSAEQILLHHEHVTHPRDFLLAKAMVA